VYFLKKNRNMILKVVGFLLVFHTTLFADSSQMEESLQGKCAYISTIEEKSGGLQHGIVQEKVEVAFDNISMMLMLVLTSILGLFFVKDEFSDAF